MSDKVSISFIRVAVFAILCVLLGSSFYANLFKISAQEDFLSFQRDSESLVLGPIVAETLGMTVPTNLGFVYPRGGGYPENIFDSYQLLGNEGAPLAQVKIASLSPCGINCSDIQVESLPNNSEIYIGSHVLIGDGQTGTINRIDPKSKSLRINTDIDEINVADLGYAPITIGGPLTKRDLVFAEYKSTYGLQGLFWKQTTITNIQTLKIITAASSSLVIISLIFLIYFRVNRTLALSFAISLFFSPWITKISNNLYWSLGSWIMPLIFSILFAKAKTKLGVILTYVLLTISFFVKFSQGFEFISTIILVAVGLAMFVKVPAGLASGTEDIRSNLKGQLKVGLMVINSSLIAFASALILLAPLRGVGLWEGLKNIFIQDVLRRTYGNPDDFGASVSESLAAPVEKVIGIYTLNWSTPVLNAPLVSSLSFVFLLIMGVASTVYLVVNSRHQIMIQLLPLGTLFLSSYSWLILAKGHSYIHAHINFVLFYVGTLPALIYMFISVLKSAGIKKQGSPIKSIT